MSQRELAKALHVAVSTISKVENQKLSPSDKLLQKYSHFFHIPLDALETYRKQDQLHHLMGEMDAEKGYIKERYQHINQQTVTLNLLYIPYYKTLLDYKEKKASQKIEVAIPKNYDATSYEMMAIVLSGSEMNRVLPPKFTGILMKQEEYHVGDIVGYFMDNDHCGVLRVSDEVKGHHVTLKSDQQEENETMIIIPNSVKHDMIIGKLVDVKMHLYD